VPCGKTLNFLFNILMTLSVWPLLVIVLGKKEWPTFVGKGENILMLKTSKRVLIGCLKLFVEHEKTILPGYFR